MAAAKLKYLQKKDVGFVISFVVVLWNVCFNFYLGITIKTKCQCFSIEIGAVAKFNCFWFSLVPKPFPSLQFSENLNPEVTVSIG